MQPKLLPVLWLPRDPPLAPQAVVATGATARCLGERVLEIGVEGLRGFAVEDTLLIAGRGELLPWVDGVSYLGADPAAPALWTPTLWRPDQPPTLVLRAIRAALKLDGTVAVVPEFSLALPISRARALDPAALASWASR